MAALMGTQHPGRVRSVSQTTVASTLEVLYTLLMKPVSPSSNSSLPDSMSPPVSGCVRAITCIVSSFWGGVLWQCLVLFVLLTFRIDLWLINSHREDAVTSSAASWDAKLALFLVGF